ncbi:hypothetical protein PsYK624_001460 [Phanerochaete sordida]|uniref:Fungal-type protein kinase domain-containing protein n=1 Tax=Phanerochaete sordida TaxID=48140 RepID=A0A9P3L6I6_9APHY|nr:hypothetical protein PsYK624_001460 [Phanerochaete sordida]
MLGARGHSELHSPCKKRRRHITGSTAWSFANSALSVIAVPADDADPFLDPLTFSSAASSSSVAPYHFDMEDGAPANVRAALVAYAHAQLARQHRTHVFQLVLCGRGARVLRWDRGGAVVSERFDYTRSPGWLAEFVWRFSGLSDSERGWDATVALVAKREQTLWRNAVQAFLDAEKEGLRKGRPTRQLPRAERSLDDTGTYPNWKIRVVDEESGQKAELIVGRPFVEKNRPCGRSTRVYLAYDLKTRRLVALKDTWRSTFASLRPEAGTYRLLQKHEVPNLPNVLYAGDVRDAKGDEQATKTPEIAEMGQSRGKWDWRKTPYDVAIHHRIVQDIAYPLSEALNEKEFVQAIYDALLGTFSRLQSCACLSNCFVKLSRGRMKEQDLPTEI